ncbi:hypothetical protein RhiirC2_763585, partial [Rhizophagus irregularis]
SSKFLNKKIDISFASYESLPCKCTVTTEKIYFIRTLIAKCLVQTLIIFLSALLKLR